MGAPLPSGSIFVSIASYRDAELVPTVRDCLDKARHTDRLHFGICWQHARDERLPDWFSGDQFRILDVDHRDSGGANWARAQVMSLWAGQDWYLQLDSHHRFAQDWDELLLDDMARARSDRAVLTTYGPPYHPADPALTAATPMSMLLNGFTTDGLPRFVPGEIPEWERLTRPRRARFLSAHLLFAPSSFIHDVPCDPELYFTGDEAILAVRAYTHGYDLFEPTRVILWHQYVRESTPKHWDDHLGDQTAPAWHQLDTTSRAKMRRIFDDENVGPMGLGSRRTLAQYETYAGVSFRHRTAQDYTRQNREPPNPPAPPDWAARVGRHRIAIVVDAEQVTPAVRTADYWHLAVRGASGADVHHRHVARADPDGSEPGRDGPLVLLTDVEAEEAPASWTLTAFSEASGWLEPITGDIDGTQPDARRPRRATGLVWESSGDRYVASLPGRAPRRRELNSSGALLVELADGRHTVRQIATYLRRAHQLPGDPIFEILDFYESAWSAGLVTMGDHHG